MVLDACCTVIELVEGVSVLGNDVLLCQILLNFLSWMVLDSCCTVMELVEGVFVWCDDVLL